MIKIDGYYYDGKSSNQLPVTIKVEQSGEVQIAGNDLEINTTIQNLKISARLGNTQRSIYLQTGAKIETPDNQAVDQVCEYFNKNILQSVLHKIEKKVVYCFIVIANHCDIYFGRYRIWSSVYCQNYG